LTKQGTNSGTKETVFRVNTSALVMKKIAIKYGKVASSDST